MTGLENNETLARGLPLMIVRSARHGASICASWKRATSPQRLTIVHTVLSLLTGTSSLDDIGG
jgi:hypothetical protein